MVRSNGGDGFIAGEIISKDDKSLTIKSPNGGSKIILYSSATEISKMASGTIADLSIGQTLTVSGQANQDGSFTAQLIQIRPAMVLPAKQ